MNKLAYDVILFEKCNMSCDHCFQTDHTKDWDLNVVNDLADRIYASFVEQYNTRNNKLDLLTISFCGGELFADGIDDSRFEIYKQLINDITTNIRQIYQGLISFEMISNGVFTKTDRVIDFLKATNSKISISYDPVSRYKSTNQKRRAITNINAFKSLGLLDEISITLTKQSIDYYVNNDDLHQFKDLSIGINYFIASKNENISMIPADDDYFRFWQYCHEHNYTNVKAYAQFINNIKHHSRDRFCICDDRLIVRNGIITYNCAIYSSNFNNCDFYGSTNVNETTVRFVKRSLAENKRNCASCLYFDVCPGICSASTLFKYNNLSNNCPNKRLIELLINNVK